MFFLQHVWARTGVLTLLISPLALLFAAVSGLRRSSQVQTKLDHEIVATLTPAPELFVQAARMQTPAILCQPESLTARQVNKLVEFIMEREALPR